ncbi:hypothetical protein [Flavobacterium sp. H122]|uniref:hypothetical protein n=1 Tax=Flavobacterium sp. H122 TaxID=2529860 RepID=UPI0010AA3AF8|nr:hypothetical protein [Flavobacterium sp. H122]
MTNKINEHWLNEELIGIDCVQKNNGEIIILNCYSFTNNNVKQSFATPICDTTIDSLEKYNSDIWTSFEVLSNRVEINNEFIVLGGEGAMGNEGFVACTDINDNFIWGAFFTNSNPFYKIEVENNTVFAFSSNNLLFKIDLFNPEKISIENKEWS